jgi:hypothetical protein
VNVQFAGLVLVVEALVFTFVEGAIDDAVLGKKAAPEVVAVAANQGVVEVE